jgi:hypothetical protein
VPYPSFPDISAFINEKWNQRSGFVHAGYGVITRNGISLIKLPEDQQKLKDLHIPLYNKYSGKTYDYVKLGLHKQDEEDEDAVSDHFNTLPLKTRVRIDAFAKGRAFGKLSKEFPDIRTRMVRRTRARDTGRLR